MTKKRIAILGSTGSIGEQTLEVIESRSSQVEVATLTADSNWQRLAEQALKYEPDSVVISNERYYPMLKEALKDSYTKVYTGSEALGMVVSLPSVDIVVSAIMGYAGLAPTIEAIKASKRVALANKETLVVAGEIIMSLSKEYRAPIIPVDSEHSAIFQSLLGERADIEKVILTASGGPFRGYSKDMLESVTIEQALSHPSWVMGRKITIDSATLMNKGLEVIEAGWLFDLKPEQIEVAVHPGSIIHSMVQFSDGAIKAQMGTPSMKLPIQYALTFPEREAMNTPRLNLFNEILEFHRPDIETFPCLRIAYDAMRAGGSVPAIMNAANEIAVERFLLGEVKFLDIPSIIENTIERIPSTTKPTLEEYIAIDAEARAIAKEIR